MNSELQISDGIATDRRINAERRFRYHRNMLLAALAIIVLAFLLEVRSDQSVVLAALPQWPLPQTCPSRRLLNIECPGCGLTRSFIYLAQGNWPAAWHAHRLGWLLAAFVVLQVPYRVVALLSRDGFPLGTLLAKFLSLLFVALLLVNWLATLISRLTG
jgi:hypothetical protein